MIDVSFLLLIYFVVTSTLDRRETDLALTMPTPSPSAVSQDVDMPPIEIFVDDAGTIGVNGVPLEAWSGEQPLAGATVKERLPALFDRLKTYSDSAKLLDVPAMAQLAISDAAHAQRFIDVMDVLADDDVGIKRVMFER